MAKVRVDEARFDAINEYTMKRLRQKGDVYGWARLSAGTHPRAMLIVSREAVPESFPAEIAGVEVLLQAVNAPEPEI